MYRWWSHLPACCAPTRARSRRAPRTRPVRAVLCERSSSLLAAAPPHYDARYQHQERHADGTAVEDRPALAICEHHRVIGGILRWNGDELILRGEPGDGIAEQGAVGLGRADS